MKKDLIDTTEAIAILGIDRSTLTRWVKRERIPAKRIGNALAFERSDVEKLKRERPH